MENKIIHSKSESRDSNDPAKKIELSAKMPQNGQKWPKMTLNGPKWPEYDPKSPYIDPK